MTLCFKNFSFVDLQCIISNWTWQEIKFGYDEKLITTMEISNYALHLLTENMLGFDDVLRLALVDDPYEDITNILSTLSSYEKPEDQKYIFDKWRYVILQYVYDQKQNIDSLQEVVDCLYCDFNYPEEMEPFVSYMPCSNPQSSINESFEEYLRKNKQKFE